MGFIPFTVACGIASVFVNWFASPIAALILCICAFVPLFFEFLMYKEFDDFLFTKQTSHNMIAVRKPKGEVKQRIVMVGHSDSQFEWTLNYLIGGLQAKLFVEIPAVVGLIVQTVFALVCIIAGKGGAAVNIQSARWFFILFFVISCVFIPFEFAFLFFQSWTKSVPGASDNLSGCYVGMAVYHRDLSGTLQHHDGTKVLVHDACANCGFDVKYESIYIGGSDAASFTQRGIPATGFAAMDPAPPRYYHTRLDTPENLRPEAIKAGIEIMIEACCMFDKDGIDGLTNR